LTPLVGSAASRCGNFKVAQDLKTNRTATESSFTRNALVTTEEAACIAKMRNPFAVLLLYLLSETILGDLVPAKVNDNRSSAP
jgi:hypothetical protein